MATAGTMTSSTGTVAGTDPTFTLTQSVRNSNEGVYLYVKYDAGTSTTLTITMGTKCVTNAMLTSTDVYSVVSISGTSLGPLTMVITAALEGNYKIPIPLCMYDDTIVVTLAYNAGGTTGTCVANILSS